MSSGRMVGLSYFGITSSISINLGIYILLIYDFLALIQYLLSNYNSRGQKK
jgi:hypothetical protein